MKKSMKAGLMLVAALVLTLSAACGGGSAPTGGNAGSDGGDAPAPVAVRYSEVIRSIFYAPHYIAMEKGFFEEEGIVLDMNTAQGSDKGAAALIAGTADISLVGPETAIYIHNQEGDTKIKIFYQLTMRDGSFLLAREQAGDFKWSDLEGKTVLGWRPGSAPQMVMNSTLIKEGVAGAEVITNLASTALPGAFASGQGDYIQLFEPVASTLEADGSAHIVASMGEAFGPFPETSYVATSAYIEKNPDVIQRFVNAVAKGNAWLQTATDDEIAGALAPHFEGTPDELLIKSVERYKAQDTWPKTPELTAEAFETLQNVLIENGVLAEKDKIGDMSAVVDMRFVQQLAKE